MRDPQEMLVFFKSEVVHDIEETYMEAREQIKILKENHVFIKNNFNGPSQLFQKISKSLLTVLQDLSENKEDVEAFVEVLIYDRIGSYLICNLVRLYEDEELFF